VLESAAPHVTVIAVEPHEEGPVFSALQVDGLIGDDESTIVTYCDFYQHWNYSRFLARVEGYDGGIAAFRGFHPASFGSTLYAYMRVNEMGELLELREKDCFTDRRHEEFASTGVYYFARWSAFRHYGQRLLAGGRIAGMEHYVSLLFNPMVEDGKRVALFEVEKFICWGTPEDLEQFFFWSDFFRSDVTKIETRLLVS
jgi:NDP-sugar pyrophosphorylase family protein